MGPTAAGKTDLAIELSQQFPCELISVDSALVYKDMHIGTAKPDAATLQRAPHFLIDICDPAEPYSAAQFRTDALQLMHEISARGHIPLLVGGTGLYFRALENGLSYLPAADPETRARLLHEAESQGWEAMHQRLAQLDPEAAARIHPNDPQRIQRALEVWELTGHSMSELQAQEKQQQLPYQVLKLVVSPQDRAILRERIALRFEQMLEQGLIEEVEKLYARADLHLEMPSIRAVGYRQVWQYLVGEYDFEEMKTQAITATRQLAKRQLTWLRKENNAVWFDTLQENLLENVIQSVAQFLSHGKSVDTQ